MLDFYIFINKQERFFEFYYNFIFDRGLYFFFFGKSKFKGDIFLLVSNIVR